MTWGDYSNISDVPRKELEEQYEFLMVMMGCMIRHFGGESRAIHMPREVIGEEGEQERLYYQFDGENNITIKLERWTH
jgi:hypothetical protein